VVFVSKETVKVKENRTDLLSNNLFATCLHFKKNTMLLSAQ
jgi:hypothetical protein